MQNGHARDEKDEKAIHDFFYNNLPACNENKMDFYERLYYYQAYCWYTFILQDLLGYYRYSQKWVDLFDEQPIDRHEGQPGRERGLDRAAGQALIQADQRDAHHLLEWALDGPTDLDNLGLLCERHHTKVHHGFRVDRQPDGRWRTWRPDGTEIHVHPALLAA